MAAKQAADADTHRAEVVDLVDLENGVELVAALENFGDLVGGHRVKAAAERVELNELETVAPAHEFRRRVEAEWYTHWSFAAAGASGVKPMGRLSSVKTSRP